MKKTFPNYTVKLSGTLISIVENKTTFVIKAYDAENIHTAPEEFDYACKVVEKQESKLINNK